MSWLKTIATGIAASALAASLLSGCGENPEEKQAKPSTNSYAALFEIKGDTLWTGGEKYVFYPADSTDALARSSFNIKKPAESIVCMSTTYLPYLKIIGKQELITGVSTAGIIYDNDIRKAAETGKIAELGYESSMDYEKAILLKPDVLITYSIAGTDNSYIKRLRELGIKVLTLPDYLENHPLGKLEYLKIYGKLTGEEKAADSIFKAKCKAYNSLKDSIASASCDSARTKVLINMPYKGTWYVPGENSYMSTLVRDAGGTIEGEIKGQSASSSVNVEDMFMISENCDIWLNPSSCSSIEEVKKSNPLFKDIKPAREGKIFNNTLRTNKYGGNDFWESGAVNPEIILKDLHSIFTGDCDSLYYHVKLH